MSRPAVASPPPHEDRRERREALETVRGLPAQLSTFVGREREISAVRSALGGARLLTLTGAGGSGKTRLAIEVVAREQHERGVNGVWVELAAVRDPALVGEAVLAALGVRDESEGAPLDRIVTRIGARPFLMVLDNGEHLVDACATLTEGLLRALPALRVLVTSRSALGVAGETAWLVPPLSLPAPGPDGVAASEAVQLFVQRAAAVVPGFALTPENSGAIAQICRRLDGLPLALELAAARLRALRPEQIAARLDDRFRLLTTGSRTALPRHQTLRAAIDWSHDLLEPRERRLLARLAVFAGSFSLEGSEGICVDDAGGAEAIGVGDVLDLLASLVEQSLVDVVEVEGIARYRLLETVREYAAWRLAERGETERWARRHAEYFEAMAADAEPRLRTRERPVWLSRLERDGENLRAALAWTRERDRRLHVRFVGNMHWYWFSSGQWPEARQWLRGALAMSEAEGCTRERAALLFSAGGLAALQSAHDSAIPMLEEAESIGAALHEERLLADARNYLAMSFNAARDARAEEVALRARPWMVAEGDLYALRLNYLIQGTSRFIGGDLAGGIEATEEGVRAARLFGLDRELAIALQQLAMLVRRQGDVPRAAALLRESLEALRRDPQLLFLARAIEYMAASAVSLAPLESARLYAAAHTIRESMGAKMWSVDALVHQPMQEEARAAVADAAWEGAWREGSALDAAQATELALSVCDRLCAHQVAEPSNDTSEFEVVHLARPAATPRSGAGAAGDREGTEDAGEAAVAFRVRALGALAIELPGANPGGKGLSYAKARELLLLLLVHPGGRTREQIGIDLWPDATSAQLRNNFHVAMHHLRRALGHPEWVRFERERYRLDVPRAVDFDVRDFEETITRALRSALRGPLPVADVERVLARYRGDFLEREEAGDWHLALRDRLARLHADALEALGSARLAAGEWGAAVEVLERLIAREPMHERAYRLLMTAHARSGNPDAALRAHRRLEATLRREGAGAPARETADLLRRLQRGEPF